MSHEYCILDLLNIKDKNIKLIDNFYKMEKIDNIDYKIIEAKLSYEPLYCLKCGCVFDSDNTYEKNGFKTSDILMLDVANYGCILRLHKQRFICHSCNKKFFATTKIVDEGCFISNQVKHAIALELKNKISEKDIAKRYRVSPNTVERIIDSYYETKKLYKNHLPEVLSFDEFKSVKSADGAMSFHMVDGKTGKTIDIVEDRRLKSLLTYFSYYTHKARSKVKLIVIDMYSPYISLIKVMFPNAEIIIDKFHLTQLISTALNKTRIMLMKKDKKNYNKLKRYWRLILKPRSELDISKWRKYRCFDSLMTQQDVVNYLINTSEKLRQTYEVYQNILSAIQSNNYLELEKALNTQNDKISSYMKTSIKTLKKYLPYIKNTLSNPYHNGFVEGNNNFIKVIKRIAFGFRSFRRFKARIMICKNLLSMKKVSA
ncbi:MAG: ISL3 family transposase [Bacilli bacterium]